MQRQLSIFDNLQPLDTAENKVNAGNWVKLRRKTPHAAYWKKGEIVQVEAVHPANGSVKFWNERSESWAYLHPDDFCKTLPPIELVPPPAIAPVEELQPVPDEIDSVPSAIEVGTESNCPHSQTDTTARVEVGAESNCHPEEFDSVPNAIALGTESEPAPEEIDSVPSPVNRYRPKGTARGGEYYRFSYRAAGGKRKNQHIPGGNTGAVLAQQRAAEVTELAAAGVPSLEICDRIKSWSRKVT